MQKAQFVAAVRESAWNDITTVEEAFLHADAHEIEATILRECGTNQFYVQVDYGAGDNPYGAIFYWGTAVEAGALHDGEPSECGPTTFDDDQGDTAPACAGVLDYANPASFATLDAYLPSNDAHAIVNARDSTPFVSMASLVAVSGVAETRLQQLLAHARTDGFVGATCSGIYDDVAISTDEATAIVALVNEASKNELDGVLAFLINHTVINTLVANRPFATASAIAGTSGVGTAVFRALRNAATTYQPFEELVAASDAIDHPDGQIRVDQHFNWVPLVTSPGATLRPALANGNEVMEAAGEAVALATRFFELSVDATPGLTDLDARTSSASFLGCYVSRHDVE